MLSFITFAALFVAVYADPTPTAPAPGTVFNEGADCTVQWNPDTSGSTTWKTMNIQLMTGDNYNMIPLSTVGTVDGTDPKNNILTYPCLKVTPHSAIYFYQFSTPNNANLYWTGRFVLAGPNGESVPPTNKTQPGTGANIPWGVGTLQDPSQASSPPSIGGGGGTPSASGSLPGAPSSSPGTSPTSAPASAPTNGNVSNFATSSTPSGIKTLSAPSSTGSSPNTNTPTTTAGSAAASSGGATGRDLTNCAVLTAIFSLLFASLS